MPVMMCFARSILPSKSFQCFAQGISCIAASPLIIMPALYFAWPK